MCSAFEPLTLILGAPYCSTIPNLHGVPKKIIFKPIFEFLSMGGVFLGVKNNTKNSGSKKNIRFLNKKVQKCVNLG